MAGPRPRDRETQQLISRMKARQARKRRLHLLMGVAAFLVLAILVVVAVALAAGGSDPIPAAGSSTTLAGGGPLTPSSVSTPGPTDPVTSTSEATPPSGPSTTTVAPTTIAPTTTTAIPAKVVVIDPGHQSKANLERESVGPGSATMKAKVSSGTSGVVTGIPESEFNLAIGLKLRDALEARGIKVIMTRTAQNVDISNIERAQMANEAKADLFVRIHADGNSSSSARGIHTHYPASIEGWTDDIAAASKEAAAIVQRELIKATGARDLGLNARSDLTGFNWSDVPVVLPELGYMTNPTEDRLLATEEYRDKIVEGLVRAIVEFLGFE
jgi:N-acetylmuramoyl-L-alanine amidase